MKLGTQDIERLIPHRHPMLLVDEVTELNKTARSIEAKKLVRPDEFFLQGHYPDFPIVPGVITCECVLQTGAILLASIFDDLADTTQVPVVTRIGKAKFSRMIRPGEWIHLKAAIVEQVSSAYYLKGSADVDGQVAARVEFVCMSTRKGDAS